MKKSIKVNLVNEIKEPIISYDVINNEINIKTDENRYTLEYSIKNEEMVYNKFKEYLNILSLYCKDLEADVKLFKKAFIIIMALNLGAVGLSMAISSLIPLIFLLTGVVIGVRTEAVLSQTKDDFKKYTNKFNYLKSISKLMEIEKDERLEKYEEELMGLSTDLTEDFDDIVINTLDNDETIDESSIPVISVAELIENLSVAELKQLSEAGCGQQSVTENLEEDKRKNLI